MKLDFRDDHAKEIVKTLNNLKELNISSYLQKYAIAYRSQYRQIRIVEIYPMTPFLAPDEQLAWYNMKTSGTFTKKVDWVQALTSFRSFRI